MNPKVLYYHSPDIDNLNTYIPPSDNNYCFLLQIFVGLKCSDGEECFSLLVCTPEWLSSEIKLQGAKWGKDLLIINDYKFKEIKLKIEAYISKVSGDNWNDIASTIDRIAQSEFRDYQEYKL